VNGAFIAFHGSWNRAPLPQEGFNVVFVPMQGGIPAGDWEVFADGFRSAEGEGRDWSARPVGVAMAPDGSLYVADSNEGRLWRIVWRGVADGS
jgi:glucose/arabinose dehydrogenase